MAYVELVDRPQQTIDPATEMAGKDAKSAKAAPAEKPACKKKRQLNGRNFK